MDENLQSSIVHELVSAMDDGLTDTLEAYADLIDSEEGPDAVDLCFSAIISLLVNTTLQVCDLPFEGHGKELGDEIRNVITDAPKRFRARLN